MLTLPPLRVKFDDLVNEANISVSPPLRLAHDFRVAALVGSEEDDVEHRFRCCGTWFWIDFQDRYTMSKHASLIVTGHGVRFQGVCDR